MEGRFDHNKLDKYKKFMDETGANTISWGDIHFDIIGEIYNIELGDENGNEQILSHEWEEFKEKVASYFLNK